MIYNELVEEGPSKDNATWLHSKAMGHRYILGFKRGLTPKYTLAILDNRSTRVLHLTAQFEKQEEAIGWARAEFVRYLMEQRLLPVGGALMEE